jgi:hypothetical protein
MLAAFVPRVAGPVKAWISPSPGFIGCITCVALIRIARPAYGRRRTETFLYPLGYIHQVDAAIQDAATPTVINHHPRVRSCAANARDRANWNQEEDRQGS